MELQLRSKKEAGEEFSEMLAILFSKHLTNSVVPEDWNSVVILLLYKKEENLNIKNCLPISLM